MARIQHNMVNIDSYELCLSRGVTKSWRQKEVNSFISETTDSAGIIIIIIEIIMAIEQHD